MRIADQNARFLFTLGPDQLHLRVADQDLRMITNTD